MQSKHALFQLVVIILLVNIISACTAMKEKEPPPTMNVIELIIQGEYGQAKAQAANDPEQLKQVNKVIADYEAALPKKLHQHIVHQRWEEIQLLLEQAEQRIPNSPALSEAKAQWRAAQKEEQQQLEIQRLIAESEALYANMILDQQLLRINPRDFSVNWRSQSYPKKAKTMAAKLLQVGEQALTENHIALAQQTLPLAHQLNATPESKAAKTELENVLARQQQEAQELQRQSLAQQRRQQFKQLVSELEGALAKEQLERSINLLKQAEAIDRGSEKLPPLKRQLQQKIDQTIEQALEQGIKHYRQEQFAEAIEDWNQVLKLDPDNKQAQINILRAEQVVSNLERLIESTPVPGAGTSEKPSP